MRKKNRYQPVATSVDGTYVAHNNEAEQQRVAAEKATRKERRGQITRRALRAVAAVALGTGISGAAAYEAVNISHAHQAHEEAKAQGEVKAVVGPALKVLGHKAYEALHANPDAVQVSNTNIPGEVQVSSEVNIKHPTADVKRKNSFSMIMKTNADGTPNPDETIYASGFDETFSNGEGKASNSYGFEMATPEAVSEGLVIGLDTEDRDKLHGWYISSSLTTPNLDGPGTTTGRISTSDAEHYSYNNGDPSAANTASAIAESGASEVDDVIKARTAELAN